MRIFLLILAVFCAGLIHAGKPAGVAEEKVLLVKIDEIGLIRIGRDTLSADQLARYIQERLFKSYLGTGQMYDRIKFEKQDPQVPEAVVEVILKEIRTGQQKALQELCLQKFSKTWEMLDDKKQSRVRKQFPVLFQQDFTNDV